MVVRARLRVLISCLAWVVVFATLARADEKRQAFAQDLASAILGSDGTFVTVGAGGGWQGVVLSPPGTSLAPITEAYSGLPGELSQVLANNTVFDRPLAMNGGVPTFSPTPIASIWENILEETRPSEPLPKDRLLSVAVMKWLFRPLYKNNRVVGYSREPSRYMVRYREFEDAYMMLQRGRDSGLWKLDPRLRKYPTYEDAQTEILREWYKSGYKAEIDTATWSFQASAGGDVWKSWAVANEQFNAHMLPIDIYTRLPETYLMPPPASWSSVSSWIRAVSKTPDDAAEYRFQMARIRIVRPWMDLDALLSGKLVFHSGVKSSVPISAGTVPSADAIPEGRMSAFVEELLIVRDVRLVSGVPENGHPLSKFAYPDGINLVGYVVRVLPEIPRPFESLSEAE